MLGYSRQGIYNNQLKAKSVTKKAKKGFDWINIALFLLLIVVLILFIVT